jgi:hypothetical protein
MSSTERGSDVVDSSDVQVLLVEDARRVAMKSYLRAAAARNACDRPERSKVLGGRAKKARLALVDINLSREMAYSRAKEILNLCCRVRVPQLPRWVPRLRKRHRHVAQATRDTTGELRRRDAAADRHGAVAQGSA